MIIGQFNDSFQPITDGVAAVVRNYALKLGECAGQQKGSFVVAPSFPGFVDDEQGYQILRYRSLPMITRPPYRIGLPLFDPTINKRLSSIPFDIVHAHCPFSAGKLALRIAKEKDIPLVASFHTKYYDDILSAVRSKWLARKILDYIMAFYSQADIVCTVNQATVETLNEYGYRGPVHVIENGTDLKSADPKSRLGSAGRRVISELVIDDCEPVLLFIGQHIWQKNLRMLCEALRILKDQMQPAPDNCRAFRMFFIGEGDAAEEMQALVAESHLTSEVSFLGVIRDRDFVRGLYERADLLLFPSLYDTAALVLQESAAALCPFVLIDGSTIAGSIRHGDNGFLSVNEPAAYADTIIKALADPELRKKVSLRAQQTLYRSWDTVVGELYAKYQDVIDHYDHKKHQAANHRIHHKSPGKPKYRQADRED